jgi:hypothetical protein
MTPIGFVIGIVGSAVVFALSLGCALALAEGCLRLVMRVVTRDNGIDCARSRPTTRILS